MQQTECEESECHLVAAAGGRPAAGAEQLSCQQHLLQAEQQNDLRAERTSSFLFLSFNSNETQCTSCVQQFTVQQKKTNRFIKNKQVKQG